jgi:nitrate reductase gamma subunit
VIQSFLLVGLPYAAVLICVLGSIWRFRSQRFGYSALSSQFLEDRQLLWGSAPWHVGIFLVLAGHAAAFLVPSVWASLVSNRIVLLSVEVIGMGAALLAIFGLAVLAFRRLRNPRVQAVTTTVDLAILGILLVQVVLGLLTAGLHRWGAQWSTGTAAPYLWSLATLRPDPALVVDLPALVQAHMALAWVLIFLVPFSRLVHLFSFPFQYAFRAPIVFVWANPRRFERATAFVENLRARRYFLRASVGLAAGGSLLAAGTFDEFVHFFFGPRMSDTESAELMEKKLARLEQNAAQKKLELERIRQEYIRVARLSELGTKKGKYFVDYEMRPALAFKGDDGLPVLRSAKCTHLGCTVGSEVNAAGQILCPCHVSYFDVKTGRPNAGAPAKDPLPSIGWLLMDADHNIVVSKSPDGEVHGKPDPAQLEHLDVYIAKRQDGRPV